MRKAYANQEQDPCCSTLNLISAASSCSDYVEPQTCFKSLAISAHRGKAVCEHVVSTS